MLEIFNFLAEKIKGPPAYHVHQAYLEFAHELNVPIHNGVSIPFDRKSLNSVVPFQDGTELLNALLKSAEEHVVIVMGRAKTGNSWLKFQVNKPKLVHTNPGFEMFVNQYRIEFTYEPMKKGPFDSVAENFLAKMPGENGYPTEMYSITSPFHERAALFFLNVAKANVALQDATWVVT